MNTRNTLILLAILLVLGGYVIWSGQNGNETDEVTDTPPPPVPLFPDLDAAAVQAVTVSSSGGESVRLTQTDGTWNIVAPVTEAADQLAVTQAITSLVALNVSRVITPTEQGLAPYGLETPAYTIELAGADGVLTRLALGDQNPAGIDTYVRRGDEELVYLVSNFTLNSLQGWIATPPIQPTPLPEPTASPTPEVTATATATVTPTTPPDITPPALPAITPPAPPPGDTPALTPTPAAP